MLGAGRGRLWSGEAERGWTEGYVLYVCYEDLFPLGVLLPHFRSCGCFQVVVSICI